MRVLDDMKCSDIKISKKKKYSYNIMENVRRVLKIELDRIDKNLRAKLLVKR